MKNINAYLAGILDGESYIGLLKHNKKRLNGDKYFVYTPRIIVSFLDKPHNLQVLNLFKNRYGGNIYNKKIYEYKSGAIRKSHNPMIVYEVRSGRVFNILKDVKEFLIIKKRQSDLILSIDYNKNGRRKKLSIEEINTRQQIMEKIKSLNGNKQNAELS